MAELDPAVHEGTRHKRIMPVLFRCGLSLSILLYLAQKIDVTEFLHEMGRIDYRWWLCGFAVYGLAYVATAIRWFFLLKIQSLFIPLVSVMKLTFIGAFFNAFLLGSTGGDVAKLLYVFRQYPQKKVSATLSVTMDRVLGMVVLLMLAMFFIALKLKVFLAMPQMRVVVLAIGFILMALFIIAMVMLLVPFQQLPSVFQRIWQRIPRRDIITGLLEGFRQHRYESATFLYAVLLSVTVQCLVFLAAYCLAFSIGLQVSFIDLAIIITIVTCIISLPVSIGGHGLREGAFLIMFPLITTANVFSAVNDREMIIVFSLLYFMLGIGWSLLGGIVYLLGDPLNE